mgnify:CR=1 FL=1|tara:strand:+ start:49 stop:171 length:123 start_codon:yes stop_codon:yes gene_type:complete
MYETLEHWKEYQKKKKIQKLQQELDELLTKLSKKNGTTKY